MTIAVGMLGPGGSPERMREGLARIEDAGLDHVVCGDHVSFIAGFGEDGLIRATGLLALSRTLSVSVGVYLLPLRHPVPVARQLASIAQMAPGRLQLGIGVGGEDRREVEVCGVDPSTRGRRTDEAMAVLRGLATGKPFSFDGRFFKLDNALVLPPPEPPVPLLVGGRSDAAVRRAGRLGDGWLGIWVSPARFTAIAGQCEEHAADAGRGAVGFQHTMQMWCGVAPTPDEARAGLAARMEALYQLPFARFERYCPAGGPDEIAAFCTPYVEAGCTRFNFLTVGSDFGRTVDTMSEVRALLASM